MRPTFPSDGLTTHAIVRMQQRHISVLMIDLVMQYGRVYHARGAEVYFLGKRECRKYAHDPRVTAELDGVHVICDHRGNIMTCYKGRRPTRPRSDRWPHGNRYYKR
jgi:hypothetical protein